MKIGEEKKTDEGPEWRVSREFCYQRDFDRPANKIFVRVFRSSLCAQLSFLFFSGDPPALQILRQSGVHLPS